MKHKIILTFLLTTPLLFSSEFVAELSTIYSDKNLLLPFNSNDGRGISILRYKANIHSIKFTYDNLSISYGASQPWIRGGEDYDFYFQKDGWFQLSKLDTTQQNFSIGYNNHQLTYEVGKWFVNNNMFFDYRFGDQQYNTEDFNFLKDRFDVINQSRTLQYRYIDSEPHISFITNNLSFSFFNHIGVMAGRENHYGRDFTEDFLMFGATPQATLVYKINNLKASLGLESDFYFGARHRDVYSTDPQELEYDGSLGGIYLIYPKASFALAYSF